VLAVVIARLAVVVLGAAVHAPVPKDQLSVLPLKMNYFLGALMTTFPRVMDAIPGKNNVWAAEVVFVTSREVRVSDECGSWTGKCALVYWQRAQQDDCQWFDAVAVAEGAHLAWVHDKSHHPRMETEVGCVGVGKTDYVAGVVATYDDEERIYPATDLHFH
jgi:hypothetical protein